QVVGGDSDHRALASGGIDDLELVNDYAVGVDGFALAIRGEHAAGDEQLVPQHRSEETSANRHRQCDPTFTALHRQSLPCALRAPFFEYEAFVPGCWRQSPLPSRGPVRHRSRRVWSL